MTLELTSDCTVVANQDTLSSAVGDETVLLHFSSGTYFGLDEIGTRVWELISEPLSVAELRDRLLDEYDVDPERCETALLALLNEMAENGLVAVDAADSA
jgi:hypothetical protein